MSSLRNAYGRITDSRKFPIQRPFTNDGTLSGSPDMDVDGSITPQEFYFQAEANRQVSVNKVQFTISDTGNTGVDDYGSISGPLANGVTFYTIIGGQEIPLTPVIKSAADFFSIGSDVKFVELSGSSRLAIYDFTLFEYSEGIILNGDDGDIFGCRINDNLSALTKHNCGIDGFFQLKGV